MSGGSFIFFLQSAQAPRESSYSTVQSTDVRPSIPPLTYLKLSPTMLALAMMFVVSTGNCFWSVGYSGFHTVMINKSVHQPHPSPPSLRHTCFYTTPSQPPYLVFSFTSPSKNDFLASLWYYYKRRWAKSGWNHMASGWLNTLHTAPI